MFKTATGHAAVDARLRLWRFNDRASWSMGKNEDTPAQAGVSDGDSDQMGLEPRAHGVHSLPSQAAVRLQSVELFSQLSMV